MDDKFAKTMRIDLIPDIPADAEADKERVIIAAPTRKHKRVDVGGHESQTEDSQYQELLQSLYDAALICDAKGHIVDVNVRAIEFLRYDRDELCSLSLMDIVSGADETLVNTLIENLENERFTLIQAYCLRKGGSFFPAEIAVNKLQLGEVHLCFFVRDITLRRQAEEMLRTEHNAIQNSSEGIAVANLTGSLEYVNPAVARMWGYQETEPLLGQDVRALFQDQETAGEVFSAVLTGEQSGTAELKGQRLDGDEFEVQVSAACNRNSDGEVVGLVLSFADISDRKRAEQAERETERQRVMLESLGAACHHLGQPATVLLANLGIMQKKMQGSDELITELVTTSIDAAEKLGEILHKLNAVNEYRTMQYLEKPDGDDSMENRILDI